MASRTSANKRDKGKMKTDNTKIPIDDRKKFFNVSAHSLIFQNRDFERELSKSDESQC
jgi:hypothetical protein